MTDTPGAGPPREAQAPDSRELFGALHALIDAFTGTDPIARCRPMPTGFVPISRLLPLVRRLESTLAAGRSPSVPVSKLREVADRWKRETGPAIYPFADEVTELCDAAERAQEKP